MMKRLVFLAFLSVFFIITSSCYASYSIWGYNNTDQKMKLNVGRGVDVSISKHSHSSHEYSMLTFITDVKVQVANGSCSKTITTYVDDIRQHSIYSLTADEVSDNKYKYCTYRHEGPHAYKRYCETVTWAEDCNRNTPRIS